MESQKPKSVRQGLVENGYFAFEDLEVYHRSVDLTADVYKLTQTFPDLERFGLISQLRRAATSVSLNIAEGKGRGTPKDFARFLLQARGSLLEVVSGLHLAERLEFTNRSETQPLLNKAFELTNKLTSFIRAINPQDPTKAP
jgi:four helix bundle protein